MHYKKHQGSSYDISFDNHIYKTISKHASIALIVLFFIILALDYFNIIPELYNPVYFFYLALIISTAYLALKINTLHEFHKKDSPIIFISKYLFLLTLIVLAINQFLKRPIITDLTLYIIGISIACGFLTFYSNKDKVEQELDDDKQKEEHEENRRKHDFPYKFPKLSKIPILNKIVRWMYKEGWWYSVPIVLIALIFIGIKIGMPLVYNGSYIDETIHLLSGLEFFKTGHFSQLYYGQSYNRGAYVSFLIGLAMLIFGKTIFVAKMVPAIIGVINFFLLYTIARKVITKKTYILILMIIYTISPWVIFNHFYIRMYVFYEFFLLIFTLLLYKIYENIKTKNNFKVIGYSVIISILSIITYYLSDDFGSIIVLFIIPAFVIFFYITNIKKNKIIRVSILILILLTIFILFNGHDKINILLHSSLQFTTPPNLKYNYYFFNLNLLFSIFFILAISQLKRKNFSFFFILFGQLILFMHMVSSSDLQILRGIIYFLPAYYLISVYSLSKLKVGKLIKITLIVLFIITIFNNYPSNYLNGPYIPSEINYKDYQLASDYINDNYSNITLFSSQDHVNIFFNTKFNEIYVLRDNKNANYDKSVEYFDYAQNITKEVLTDLPVLSGPKEFENIINSNNNTKIVFLDEDLNGWVTPGTMLVVNNNFVLVKKFNGIRIYELKYANSTN